MLLNVNTLDFHYDIIWIRHSCPTGTINPHPTNGSREKKTNRKVHSIFFPGSAASKNNSWCENVVIANDAVNAVPMDLSLPLSNFFLWNLHSSYLFSLRRNSILLKYLLEIIPVWMFRLIFVHIEADFRISLYCFNDFSNTNWALIQYCCPCWNYVSLCIFVVVVVVTFNFL